MGFEGVAVFEYGRVKVMHPIKLEEGGGLWVTMFLQYYWGLYVCTYLLTLEFMFSIKV